MNIGGTMKKISILSLHLGYGGIEKSIIALANLLADKYNVEIACSYRLYDKPAFNIDKKVKIRYLTKDIAPNKDEFKEALKRKNIHNIIQEGNKSINVLKLRKMTMINYIKKCDSDIIISSRDIFDDWLGKYAKEGVVKIGWEHNHFHGNMKYANKITKYARKLDYFVLVSKELRDYYSDRLKGTKCRCVYIPNIIDKLPKYLSRLNKKRLVSVGRLSPEKGYMDLLKLFNILHNNHKDWVLDIIGDGSEKDKLDNYISKNNLSSCVTLHGYQNKNYIDNILNKSSLYVMTSYTESFGIVLIEAMSHGIPCVAYSSAEGANELIRSGFNGYLIKNRNQEMMIKKIEDLMEDYSTREKIGKNSRKFSKKFIGENVIKNWFSLLEEGEVYEKEE